MEWEWDEVKRANCVVFFKVREEWGELSNMHNEFPLRVGGVPVGSSEALYQAMRFPHRPDAPSTTGCRRDSPRSRSPP